MHTKYINRNNTYQYICLLLLFFYACKKNDLMEDTRLFRPVAKGDLQSDGNWIGASWQSIKGAVAYEVQVSQDTFKTVDVTVQIDKSAVMIENLKWNQLYQVRVRAIAEDTTFNSKMSDLGAIKTAKFPTILKTPAISDITDVAVKVGWTNSGAAVTSIKILKASDSSVAKEVSVTNQDVTNQYKVVDGLTPATSYIIFLYSGTSVRGWENFSTKAPFTGTVIDLRSISGVPSILQDTLPDIASGSIVILKRGTTYQMTTSYAFTKTVTIVSGDDLTVSEPATILLNTTTSSISFDVASGSVIDSIVFNNVNFVSSDVTLTNNYVMNISQPCTVGKIVFESCNAATLRGFFRVKDNAMTISSLRVNNCIIGNIGTYGVIIVDNANAKVENIYVGNSTLFKIGNAQAVIRNTANNFTQSITVENCTVNEAPFYNRYLVDCNANNVSSGITIKFCLFGIGKESGGLTTVRGVRAGAGTTISGGGNYGTKDYQATSNAIPGVTLYTKNAAEVFADPANGNFKIIDAAFPGKNSVGDPRWRP
jgi:hypothetical protein